MLGGEENSENKSDGNDKQEYNPYVWPTIVVYDATEPDTVKRFLSTGDVYISECAIFTYEKDGKKEDLILAPKYIYYSASGSDYKPTQESICHHDNQVYYFSSILPTWVNGVKKDNYKEKQNEYSKNIKDKKSELTGFDTVQGHINK